MTKQRVCGIGGDKKWNNAGARFLDILSGEAAHVRAKTVANERKLFQRNTVFFAQGNDRAERKNSIRYMNRGHRVCDIICKIEFLLNITLYSVFDLRNNFRIKVILLKKMYIMTSIKVLNFLMFLMTILLFFLTG